MKPDQERVHLIKNLMDSHQLQSMSLLRGVEIESIQDLLEECPIQDFKKDEVLIKAGRPNHSVYLLLSGLLSIHLSKLTLGPSVLLGPGEIVGEMSVIDRQLTSATVVAHEDSCVLLLDEKVIWSLVDIYPIVARNLLFILSQRLRHGNVLIDAPIVEKVSQQELEEFQLQQIEAEPLEDEVEAEPLEVEDEADTEPSSLYKAATSYVLESIRQTQAQTAPDLERGGELVRHIIDSVMENSALLLLATNRRQEFAVSAHSVNVTILSLRLAQTLNYNLESQVRVGLAALLHEMGVVSLPKQLVHETKPVSSEVKQRPVYGAKILQGFYPEYDWLFETVGQVYEREDGKGFPLGLAGKEIREEAKILGIMDVFEACIHDRPYRNALTGYQLLEELTRDDTKSFSDRIVKALLNSFSLYPYNEYVLLNTKELARVVEVNPANSFRPLVQILYDRKGVPYEKPRETDLAQSSLLFITEAISYHELPG
jgi:HD-GYP domain-containing protein (c-di-GMP phosphodiesterase class II)